MQADDPRPEDPRRRLPSVDALARTFAQGREPGRREIDAARDALRDARARIAAGQHPDLPTEPPCPASALVPVVNLSGVVLHTGLGRAAFGEAILQRAFDSLARHAALELDLDTGDRGDRQAIVREDLLALTGAEGVLVVNNAAAGVILTLSALCHGGEVVISRGQMVEIGGSFRMPDVIAQSGCRLVEVGCTNKTRLSDYADTTGEETRAYLRCHPSNFRIVGFTESPSLSDLAALARERGVLCIDDMGTGCLVDTSQFGLPRQATLADAVRHGADVVIASGDKLLGGPQAGLILGRANVIARLAHHPLARALRVDKLTLAVLSEVLQVYRYGDPIATLPTLRYLARTVQEVQKLAERLRGLVRDRSVLEAWVTEVGGGSLPGYGLPTWRVGLEGDPEKLLTALRIQGVIARIERGRVWLDPRTAERDEVERVRRILPEILS